MMKRLKFVFLLLFAALAWSGAIVAQDDEAAQQQILKGKIGPYNVTMHLSLPGASESDTIGYYYYDAYPTNRFTLKMVSMEAINASGSMHLKVNEYTGGGKHTGTFDGQYECRGDYYSGTFTNSKGKRYKFTLE